MVDVSKVTLGEMGLFGELKQEIERLTTDLDRALNKRDEFATKLITASSEGARYRDALNTIQFRGSPEVMLIAMNALKGIDPASDKLTENPVISPGNPVDDKHRSAGGNNDS